MRSMTCKFDQLKTNTSNLFVARMKTNSLIRLFLGWKHSVSFRRIALEFGPSLFSNSDVGVHQINTNSNQSDSPSMKNSSSSLEC